MDKNPFFSHLRCRECGRQYAKEAVHVCEFDFGPLEAAYDYDAIRNLGQIVRQSGRAEELITEMEHALRKHCTIHFDEDPAFYQRLSEKLEKLIEAQKDNWLALAQGYEQLRREAAAAGRFGVSHSISGSAEDRLT